jgi:hypothetical protein
MCFDVLFLTTVNRRHLHSGPNCSALKTRQTEEKKTAK